MTEQEAWWRAAERIRFGRDHCLCVAMDRMLNRNEITLDLRSSMRERLLLFRPHEYSDFTAYWWDHPWCSFLSVRHEARQERIMACLFLAAMAAR
ncbi:MAG: hypothetical protein ACYTEX_28040 [Planctomycetota bacterium]|jgi:hypothetical protein